MTDNERVHGFIARVDRFIAIAEERIKRRQAGGDDVAPPGLLEYLVKGLSKYRAQALIGKLPASEGVVTLGVLRAVGDWNEPSGSELVKAAKDLEAYYLEQMK